MRDIDEILPNGCGILDLPQHIDERGGLTYVEQYEDIPFDCSRVYYIYDVPVDGVRGEHAHHNLEQVMIAVNGSFDVVLDDGTDRKTVTMDKPEEGLYVAPMTWREMHSFSKNAVCLVLASNYYTPEDYINSYDEFAAVVK